MVLASINLFILISDEVNSLLYRDNTQVINETLPTRQTLTKWCKYIDQMHSLGLYRSYSVLVMFKCLSLFSLIASFYFFSAIAHDWVVEKSLGSDVDRFGLCIALICAWLAQGVFNHRLVRAKAQVLAKMESTLMGVLAARQHALVRQHSAYFWQTLWLEHLSALANWALEYRVQQLVAVIVPIVALAVIFSINPFIGAGLLITIPVVPVFMIIVGKGAAALHKKHFVALERLGSMFTDRLNALSVLASFQAHDKQTELLTQASDNLNARTMKVVSVAFLSNSVLDFFATLSVALVAVFIGFSLLGEIAIGPTITLQQGLWVLLVVPLLLSEMKKLGQVYHQKAQAQAAQDVLEPLFSMYDVVSQFNHTDNVFSQFCAKDMHVFEHDHVSNGLDTSNKDSLLCVPSLTLNKGDHVLLSGRSGSGKSLLLEALGRQRPATHSLNTRVAWLTQQPVILPGTVRENLCLDSQFDDKQLKEVLSRVELLPWLHNLSFGLDTEMSDYPPLSGGEAQRLSLARVLLRNDDVWLLDEPTAHLSDSQHHRLASLIYTLSKNKTVVWASHKALPAEWFNGFWEVKNGTFFSTSFTTSGLTAARVNHNE